MGLLKYNATIMTNTELDSKLVGGSYGILDKK